MADEEGEKVSDFGSGRDTGTENHTGSEHGESIPEDTSASSQAQDTGYQASFPDDSVFGAYDTDLLDEGSVVSLLPETLDSSSDMGLEIGRRRRHSTPDKVASFLVFDVRGGENFVEGCLYNLPVDMKEIARGLRASLSDIQEIPIKVDGSRVLVRGLKTSEKYLLVKNRSRTCCMRFMKNADVKTVSDGFNKIRHDHSERHESFTRQEFQYLTQLTGRRLPFENLQVGSVGDNFSVLYKKTPVEISDVLKLPSFALVEIVEVVHIEWRIHYRYKPLCDVRHIVPSKTTDTLRDIKQKLLEQFSEVHAAEKKPLETVWLTQEKAIVSDALVRETYDIVANHSHDKEKIISLCQKRSLLRLKKHPRDNSICVDDVYLDFQPKSAFSVEVSFKDHVSDGSLLIVSPQISPADLREEVAKVVQKRPNSIRISVNRHKLDSKINLRDELCSPGCKIVVTSKKKISLHIHLVFIPPQQTEEEKEYVTEVFSYDMTSTLKTELCSKVGILAHMVDLYFERRLLGDDATFSDNRIRDKDTVEARVFPNRVKLLVRMPNKRWYHLLVDDCLAFTVGQVKSFAQSLQGVESIHSCELTAIVRDRVVSDTELLGGLFPERCCLPRLAVVQVESLCFTADTSYKGTFAVCRSTESTYFQQVLAMFNGELLFYGTEVTKEDGKVSEMLEKRRHNPQPPVQVEGIRIVSSLQPPASSPDQSPALPTRGSSSPALLAEWAAACPSLPHSTPIRHSTSLQDMNSRKKPGARRKTGVLKRTGSVKFSIGSSTSELESQDEGRTSASTPTLSELPTEEVERGAGEDDSDVETVTDDAGEDLEQRGRQRDRSPEADGTASEILSHTSKSRSKSCPPFPVSVVNPHAQLQRSGSDPTIMTRITTIVDTICDNRDGTLTLNQTRNLQARGPLDMMQKLLKSSPLPQAVAGASQAAVTCVQDQACQSLSYKDPAFKHVKEKVVREVAKHLGKDGLMVIRELGVTQNVIDQASAAHPDNIVEKYMFLLRAWCTSTGGQASKAALKAALKAGMRQDLADAIDEMDPEPSEADKT